MSALTTPQPQPDFRLSSDSKALAQALLNIEVGETLAYSELTAVIGRNVQGVGADALHTARAVLERDPYRMVFATLRGVGVRRLDDAEIVDTSDKAREHVRRHTRRATRKLECVKYDALSHEMQTKHNAAMSIFGVLREMASDKGLAKIKQEIADSGSELPAAKAAMIALGMVS